MEIHKDLPRDEIVAMAQEALDNGGKTVHFKFTCPHCGQRCTFEEPNRLYENGTCFACGQESKVEMAGFLLVLSIPVPADEPELHKEE